MRHPAAYVEGDSLIHRLDPRVKILSLIAMSFLILGGSSITLAMDSFLFVCLCLSARVSFQRLWAALRPATVFLSLLFLLHLAFTEGRALPLLPDWPVTITYEGLQTGLTVTWKFGLLLAWASLLTMTTSTLDLVGGMEAILMPLRGLGVKTHDLGLMISMAMRFVPVVREEMERVKMALLARGASFGTGPLHRRARAMALLTWPVVLGTFRRADNLAMAIEARGYGRGPRTRMRDFTLSSVDYGAMVVMALLATLQWLG